MNNLEIYVFMFVTAVIFTLVGWKWGTSAGTKNTVNYTINELIKKGYLRTRINQDGEIEILKPDEK